MGVGWGYTEPRPLLSPNPPTWGTTSPLLTGPRLAFPSSTATLHPALPPGIEGKVCIFLPILPFPFLHSR